MRFNFSEKTKALWIARMIDEPLMAHASEMYEL